jgi:carboxypeptidase Taq
LERIQLSSIKNPRLELLEEKVKAKITLINDIRAASRVLTWDQETNMPKGSSVNRAEQVSTLETLAHYHMVSFDTIDLANEITESFEPEIIENSIILKYFISDHIKALKTPNSFVKEFFSIRTLALDSWKNARLENRFRLFRPYLSRLIELKKNEAMNQGYGDNFYEGIINQYEPGITIQELNKLFGELKTSTIGLIDKYSDNSNKIDNSFMIKKYSVSKQLSLVKFLAESMNFDFNHGRIDVSAHPFSTSVSPDDVRITVRVKENDIRECLFGAVHEIGQAIYSQNIDRKLAKTFAQQAPSFGLYLSQSFLWENMIARTVEFWHWALPHLKVLFPAQLENISSEMLFAATNKLNPSLIRTDADYITYNLHIILRYEIEHELFNGDLSVEDIPELWKSKMIDMFGFYPVSDSEGCLQDMQWAFGGFGIFPVYALANIYSAIIWSNLKQELPGLMEQISKGNFSPLVFWLSKNIYKHGKTITTNEIFRDLFKKEININDFIKIVTNRFSSFN